MTDLQLHHQITGVRHDLARTYDPEFADELSDLLDELEQEAMDRAESAEAC